MAKHPSHKAVLGAELTDQEIIEIVEGELPHWKRACHHTGVDTVILQQYAFGRSLDEIFLMHAAIRYAGLHGKAVTIAPYGDAKLVGEAKSPFKKSA